MTRFSSRSTETAPSEVAPRKVQDKSKLGDEAPGPTANSMASVVLPPGYLPSTDLVATLRAQAAKFTQEERLAELRRLREIKPGKGQTMSTYSGNNEGQLRYMALILPEDIPILVAELEKLHQEKKDPDHTYQSALFKSWASADVAGLDAWVRTPGNSGVKRSGVNALMLEYAEIGGATGWDKMVSAGRIQSPGEEVPNWCFSLIEQAALPDPRGVYERTLKIKDESLRRWASQEALKVMAKTGNFQEALELAQKEEPGVRSDTEQAVVRGYLTSSNPDIEGFMRHLEETDREQVKDTVKQYMGLYAAEGFKAWLKAHPEEGQAESASPQRLDAVRTELGALSPSERFERTLAEIDRMEDQTPDEQRYFASTLKNSAVQLAKGNPRKALRTLASLSAEQISQVAPGMVAQLADYDPKLAQEALGKITDNSARFKAMRGLVKAWAVYDQEGARTWVDRQDALPENDFAELQSDLEVKPTHEE